MSVLDWWRLLYAAASTVIFVLVVLRLRKTLLGMGKDQLYWALAISGFVLATVISSLESIYFHDHLSVRTPLFMACSFWCVLALREERKKDAQKSGVDDATQP